MSVSSCLTALSVQQADRLKLGELLLSGVPTSNRLVAALVVRVEERELLQEALQLVAGWLARIEQEGEAYTPPDAPSLAAER